MTPQEKHGLSGSEQPEDLGTPIEVLMEQGEYGVAKPYRFGEKVDTKDRSRDFELCPVCASPKKERHTVFGKSERRTDYTCRGPGGHQWSYNATAGTVEPIQGNLPF